MNWTLYSIKPSTKKAGQSTIVFESEQEVDSFIPGLKKVESIYGFIRVAATPAEALTTLDIAIGDEYPAMAGMQWDEENRQFV